jgi:hypothetical protein
MMRSYGMWRRLIPIPLVCKDRAVPAPYICGIMYAILPCAPLSMYGVSDPFAALEHPSTRVHLLRPIPYIRISNVSFSEYPFRPKIAKDKFLSLTKSLASTRYIRIFIYKLIKTKTHDRKRFSNWKQVHIKTHR